MKIATLVLFIHVQRAIMIILSNVLNVLLNTMSKINNSRIANLLNVQSVLGIKFVGKANLECIVLLVKLDTTLKIPNVY